MLQLTLRFQIDFIHNRFSYVYCLLLTYWSGIGMKWTRNLPGNNWIYLLFQNKLSTSYTVMKIITFSHTSQQMSYLFITYHSFSCL